MSADAKYDLDRFEGLGVDYLEKEVAIMTATGEVSSHVYFAHPARIDPGATPYDWYLRLVVEGARHHGLPEAYVERIAARPSLPDPDRGRAERAIRILARR
jgi:gamma-glutamylcyclotransferase